MVLIGRREGKSKADWRTTLLVALQYTPRKAAAAAAIILQLFENAVREEGGYADDLKELPKQTAVNDDGVALPQTVLVLFTGDLCRNATPERLSSAQLPRERAWTEGGKVHQRRCRSKGGPRYNLRCARPVPSGRA